MNKRYVAYVVLTIFITTICHAQNIWQSTNNFHSLKICLQSKDTIYACNVGGGIAKSVPEPCKSRTNGGDLTRGTDGDILNIERIL